MTINFNNLQSYTGYTEITPHVSQSLQAMPIFRAAAANPFESFIHPQIPSKPVKNLKLPSALETTCRLVPILRKPLSGFEDFQAGNWIMGAGMIFRAINEGKEDLNDIKAIITNPPYRKEWQHPFWFVKGCVINKFWIGQKLRKYDKTLFDIIPLKYFAKIGLTDVIKEKGTNLVKIEGSKTARLLGTAALRFPVLGAGLYTIMEIDHIIKSDHKFEDTALAPVRVATIIGLASLGGAAGRNFGRIPEFLGMGLGIMAGCKIAKDYLMAGTIKSKKEKPNKKLNILI